MQKATDDGTTTSMLRHMRALPLRRAPRVFQVVYQDLSVFQVDRQYQVALRVLSMPKLHLKLLQR